LIFLPLGLLLLLVTACASTTPAQRIAIHCNPVTLAVGLAWALTPFGELEPDCAQAIKDEVEETKSKTATPRKSPEPPAVQDTSARGSTAE
jgi:hypothetical protein